MLSSKHFLQAYAKLLLCF